MEERRRGGAPRRRRSSGAPSGGGEERCYAGVGARCPAVVDDPANCTIHSFLHIDAYGRYLFRRYQSCPAEKNGERIEFLPTWNKGRSYYGYLPEKIQSLPGTASAEEIGDFLMFVLRELCMGRVVR